MTQDLSFAAGDPVTVKCFSFTNPESINGPFGSFQLWIDGSNVQGQMTIRTLFGLGSTTRLNLTGTLSGTSPIVCTLQGQGVSETPAPEQSASSVDVGLQVSFAADWSTGQLTLSGLEFPVQAADCTTV